MDILKQNMISAIYRLMIIIVLPAIMSITSVTHAQISPGDLSTYHEALEGLSNCTKCHEMGEGPTDGKCLECHKLVKRSLDEKRGYHVLEKKREEKQCLVCHSEHAGRDFALITLPETFTQETHGSIGYELVGKHRVTKCRDCHNPANIQEDLKSYEPSVDMIRTYFGLDSTCLSCHRREHRGQLPDRCSGCHTMERFKPAELFDHDKAKFLLTGKHKNVDCTKCHTTLIDPKSKVKQTASYTKYVDIKHSACTDCHKDIHQDKFGQNCTKCHSTSGWLKVSAKNFDHNKTNYPLRGKHTLLVCEKCHKGGISKKKMKSKFCTDCHSDLHFGQFAQREDKGKCESCHSVDGFKPANYTLADHNQSEFKLFGAHQAQPCIACHTVQKEKEKEYRKFVFEDKNCTGCHKDQHNAQFTATAPVKICTDCHTNDSWLIVDFDHTQNTTYPLEGAHKKVACNQCHVLQKDHDIEGFRYRPLGKQCKDCHDSNIGSLTPRQGEI